MEVVPWFLITLNMLGTAIMVKFGLPQEVPFVGRKGADPLFGYLGLMLWATSIAVRVMLNLMA